ncbi:general glycosylation pathway protein [Sulfurovum mangrovi]|uniref:general glycosylation pathway protein n=1 Tax=Sulfurovum mangrovi TaxID=2893889 RepID=UPI001E56598E|nr:general glycosylation pathway protein [Sulfurovum mangrovi]UFH58277.1 general glycosylation pathway protein [Sulfurovum mangrovi]
MGISKLITDKISRTVYGLISLSLGIISLAMIVSSLYSIWTSLHEQMLFTNSLLDAVGFIVIGTAIFDVSRFLMEEEVFKVHGEETSMKQRMILIKFLVIIIIAISLEALVFVFSAAKKDISLLVYPTFLLLTAVMLVIGLGVYQRMTKEEK